MAGKAILLSKDTGMINEPSVDPKGVLSVSMLIQPDVFPGRLISLQGQRIQGNWKIEQTTHSGDTRSTGPWQIAATAKAF